jgi:hypothetical protein
MSKYTRRLGAPVLVAVATLLGACRSDAKKGPDSTALGADSTLNRDLALANRDSTAQPQLKDVPANSPTTPATTPAPTTTTNRPAPRTPTRSTPRTSTPPVSRPAPTPPPQPTTRTTPSGNTETRNAPGANPGSTGGGAVGMIPAGTTLNTAASSKICTNTNAVGDHVTATVESAVSGSNGAVIPAGATLNMTVTQLKRSENSNDPIVMEFAVNSVSFGGHTYPLDATVTSANVTRVKDQPTSKDAQKVAIGAVAGAIAGKILGKSTKATVIGGAAGAAAGAATAAATANYQGCINSGGSIVVKLNSAAQIRAT